MKAQTWRSSANSRGYILGIISCVWVAAIFSSLAWNWLQADKTALMFAQSEASASFNKDLVYRKWTAMQGGVYVSSTKDFGPNPYLAHLPNRDVETTNGKHLTLINPAYMTRLVHQLGQEQYGAKGHITSLKPFNPNNVADPWETEALHLFEKGSKEVVARAMMDGKPYFRLMRPLITEASCLSCHDIQGYKVGDIRGGISVSVPYSIYEESAVQQQRQLLFAHLLLGIFGLVGLWACNVFLRSSEVSLLKSEARHKNILRTAMDGFWIVDNHGRILEVNQTYSQMSGYSIEELLTMHISDLEVCESKAGISSRNENIIAEGDKRFESQHRRKDGSIIDVEVSAQYSPLEGGKFVVFLRDVTESKRAEVASRLSEERFRKIFEESPIGLAFLGKQREIFLTNQQYRDFLGYNETEILEKGFAGLLHPDDLAASVELSNRLRNNEIPKFHMEQRYIRKDGAVVWADTSITVLRAQDGQLIHTIGWVKDITERKQNEEETKKLQAQLMNAQKLEAIGTLAGGIAHDFNNILGAMIGYAEMAREDSLEGSLIANDLDQVLKAGDRAKNLVKQILAFSRQTQVERISLDPALLVKETVKLLRSSIPSTIAIEQDVNKSSELILADPTQFHQILMNLCTNAFHAMEKNGGTLSISLTTKFLDHKDLGHEPQLQPGKYVQLSIKDTGPGIAPEVKKRIFDPYFTTKKTGKGTGMGLAITHGIVKSYDGFITCDSQMGAGTVFHVYLPSRKGEIIPETISQESPPVVGSKRILYVDDEAMLAEMGQTMLERLGYSVTVRTSSLEALTIFSEQPYSL